MRSLALIWCLVTCVPSVARSQGVPFRDSGADRIRLKSHQLIEGIVIAARGNGAWVAVERSWLDHAYPKLAQQWSAEFTMGERRRRAELKQRITDWMETRPQWDELQAFLQTERKRLEGPSVPKSKFYLKLLDQRNIDSIRTQDRARKLIYLAAWIHGETDVCRQPVSRLKAKLQDRKVDLSTIRIEEWVAMLPPKPDTEIEWRTRQALVEWQFGERLAFQGTRDFWLPVDDAGQLQGALPNDLISSLLGQRKQKPLEEAVRRAEQEKLKGFTVQEMTTNAVGIPQSISHRFYAQVADGEWEPVLRVEVAVQPGKAEAAQQLAEDPQIKGILSLIRSLGLPLDANQLQAALGAGAGVQQAMRDASQRLTSQMQLYATSLDVPLWWPK